MGKNVQRSISAAALVMFCGLAHAQQGEKPLLSGPEVKDTRPALVEESFGGEKMGKARMGAMEALPPETLRRILRSMHAEGADPALKLMPEQGESIRAIMQGFEAERRAYMDEHRAELAALREKAGLREGEIRERLAERGAQRGGGGRERPAPEAMGEGEGKPVEAEGARRQERRRVAPGGAEPGAGAPAEVRVTPEQEAARQELRKMMQGGPSMGDLQRRIYAELSPEQRAFVDAEVLRLAEERAQERDMQMLERKRADRAQERAGQPGAAGPGGPEARARFDWSKALNPDGTVNLDALPERMRERLASMSEEDRRKALETLKTRVQPGDTRRKD